MATSELHVMADLGMLEQNTCIYLEYAGIQVYARPNQILEALYFTPLRRFLYAHLVQRWLSVEYCCI